MALISLTLTPSSSIIGFTSTNESLADRSIAVKTYFLPIYSIQIQLLLKQKILDILYHIQGTMYYN